MNDPQVMLDLETMGTGNNAAIIAIGAVEFDLFGIKKEFYEVVNLQSAVDVGGIIDSSTVLWWMKQSDAARKEFEITGISIQDALHKFSEWLPSNSWIWGNGTTFDNVVLRSTYRMCSIKPAWSFRNDKCYRTLKDLLPHITAESTAGTAHNALHDATYQALHAIKLLNAIAK